MASFHPEAFKGTANQVADLVSVLLLQTDKNAVFRVTGWAGFAHHGKYYRLCGTKGSAESNRTNDRVTLVYNDWTKPENVDLHSSYDAVWQDPVLGDFIKALENGVEPYWNVYRATTIASCAILAHRSILNGNVGYNIPDFRREEDRLKYENDKLSPFPDKNGNADIPTSSRPYKPSTEDYEQAMRDWIETGVRNQ